MSEQSGNVSQSTISSYWVSMIDAKTGHSTDISNGRPYSQQEMEIMQYIHEYPMSVKEIKAFINAKNGKILVPNIDVHALSSIFTPVLKQYIHNQQNWVVFYCLAIRHCVIKKNDKKGKKELENFMSIYFSEVSAPFKWESIRKLVSTYDKPISEWDSNNVYYQFMKELNALFIDRKQDYRKPTTY